MPEPTIRIDVDVTNPGQFFACCGLLELADRLWPGAEGWFEESLLQFCVVTDFAGASAEQFLQELSRCELTNTMPVESLQRYEQLKSMSSKERSSEQTAEKKEFDKQWRELPLVLGTPFNLTLDWFRDGRAGGSRFKTWAGQQSVYNIAQDMLRPISEGKYNQLPVLEWLTHPCGLSVDFNFDSESSIQSSALDVGFVLDPLGMGSVTRPLLHFLAFVGLQRFRAFAVTSANAYTYIPWTIPLLPSVAATVASSVVTLPKQRTLTFPLLYRTKYLKSFLPATLNGE